MKRAHKPPLSASKRQQWAEEKGAAVTDAGWQALQVRGCIARGGCCGARDGRVESAVVCGGAVAAAAFTRRAGRSASLLL